MSALVTGANGFIGQAVSRALLHRGVAVTALTRTEATGRPLREAGASLAVADVLDVDSLPACDPEAVFHFASAPTEQQGSARYANTDVNGMRNLRLKYPDAHVLYASSIWVYGTSQGTLDESAPLSPTTSLGAVKAAVERLLERMPRATILRIGATYPGGSFGRQLIEPIRRGRFLSPGRGESTLGLASVVDTAEAFVSAFERSIFGCFNLVDDHPISWAEMARTIAAHFGRPRPRHVPLWMVRVAKGRNLAQYVNANLRVSNARFKAAGFRLRHPSLASGLEALVPNCDV